MSVFKKYLINQSMDIELKGHKSANTCFKDDDLVIAVMPNSWVFVGLLTTLDSGRIRLDCCYNVHEWGTTEGLGELALKGPLPATKLNESAPIYGKPIFLIKANMDVW